ncbi:DMT family transporter [Nakamurella sp. PAMC28650]|uniref:DMT family transporter n=1 Tax=Nakamurella sp. PAMC28650 TaxID=2762325 RepID=UPI00164D9F01|nr:DMT family transporter [Nakamurella sp. PAMC28650]QNK81401.1 DMT family transporter [Nakamurella sp. PAMC28650]
MSTAGSPASSSRSTGLALVGLLTVAATWGSSFPLTKSLLERMTPLNFLAIRFTIAGVLMLLVFQRAVRGLTRQSLVRGAILGVTYGIAQIVQTTGLAHTSASVSGFITGMYVVLTPICAAVLLHTAIGRRVWLGAVLASAGLAILALTGFHLGFGEAITLVSAVIYALHIVGLGAWSTARTALGLAVVQIVCVGLVSLVAATIADPGGLTLPGDAFDWTALLYMAVISGAIAMIVQSWAQAHLAASRAAIIMSTEPGWAALFSITFLHEPLTWRIAVGGGLMLVAMVVVETGPRRPGEAPHPDEVPKLAA